MMKNETLKAAVKGAQQTNTLENMKLLQMNETLHNYRDV